MWKEGWEIALQTFLDKAWDSLFFFMLKCYQNHAEAWREFPHFMSFLYIVLLAYILLEWITKREGT